jgi:membrane protein required for colicin V production
MIGEPCRRAAQSSGMASARRAIRADCRDAAERNESSMPITFLDLILLVVMLVSAMLAMIRGFMREILSIAAWVIGALTALYFSTRLGPLVKAYFSLSDTVSNVLAAAAVFLVTLLVVSVITVRISDMILDSRVGALDRTLGFLFGLGRGLLIVVVAFLFFDWLVPAKSQPTWVQNAKSRVVLQSTGDWLMSLLPDDPENTILKRLRRPKGEQQAAPETPDTRSSLDARGRTAMAVESTGYGQSDRDEMRRLIENRAAGAR